MKKPFFVLVMFAVSSLAAMLAPGCGDDDPAPTANLGSKGESCEQRANCAAGLACVSKVCVAGDIAVKQTTKECVLVACSANADCCPAPPAQATCDQYNMECTQFNDQDACDNFNTLCGANRCNPYVCDAETSQCKQTVTCQMDFDCFNSGHTLCNNGACVDCKADADCGEGNKCANGTCQNACNNDGDCADFERCQSGVCVEGKCATDRECAAATRNALATCGSDGECVEPCSSDLECGDPENWNFHACINKKCVYVGCDSDKECQFYFNQTGIPAAANTDIVCREKK